MILKCGCPGCMFLVGMILGSAAVTIGFALWMVIEWVRFL